MSKITEQKRLTVVNNTSIYYHQPDLDLLFILFLFSCHSFISLIPRFLARSHTPVPLSSHMFHPSFGKMNFLFFFLCAQAFFQNRKQIMHKHNNLWAKHGHRVCKPIRTHQHMQLLTNLRGLGRCVTRVCPLLTPSVAQQGVFVWFPRATVGERGGGWLMPRGRAAATRSSRVCYVYVCARVAAEDAGGPGQNVTQLSSVCLCMRVCQSGMCCCQQANSSWHTHTDYWSQKVKCTLCSFLSLEVLSFCLPNFLSSHFYFLYFSLCHTLMLFLSPRRFLSFAPSSLHHWWF